MQNLTGTLIQDYRLDQLLFEDTSMQAYRGVHVSLKKERTVYLIHHTNREVPASVYVEELSQNVQAAARLDIHLGLVNVHGVGTVEEASYFITDMVGGPSLAEILATVARNRRHLAVHDVVELCDRAIRAMEHAYKKGGLFVSLHPHNIKFRPDPDRTSPLGYLPALTDMGIAANQSGRFHGRSAQPSDLIREFGLFFLALLTNQTTYDLDQQPDFDQVPLATQTWPFAHADRVNQLLQEWILQPSDQVEVAVNLIFDALKQFRSIEAIPGQVRLREVYEHLSKPKPEKDRESDGNDTPEPEVVPTPPAEQEVAPNPAPPIPSSNQAMALEIQIVDMGGQSTSYPLNAPRLLLGRSGQVDITIADPMATRQHLQVELLGSQVSITDLKSLNGTFLDNRRIPAHSPFPWNPGQEVRIGGTRLYLQAVVQEQAPVEPPVVRPEAPAVPRPDIAIPSNVHVNALGREVPISAFTMLTENRLVGFHVAMDETYAVEPGQTIAIPVYVVNFGRESVTIGAKVENIPPAWFSIAQPEFKLRSGEQREMDVTVSPARHQLSKAGPYRPKISLADLGKVAESGQPWANRSVPVRVKAFSDFTYAIEPQQTSNEMTLRIKITNQGNGTDTFAIFPWSDNPDALAFDIPDVNLNAEPGQSVQMDIRISPKKQFLIGSAKRHQISIQISGKQANHTEKVEFLEKSRLGF